MRLSPNNQHFKNVNDMAKRDQELADAPKDENQNGSTDEKDNSHNFDSQPPEFDDSDFEMTTVDKLPQRKVKEGRDYSKLEARLEKMKKGDAMKIPSDKLSNHTARSHLYESLMLRTFFAVGTADEEAFTTIQCLQSLPKNWRIEVTQKKKEEKRMFKRVDREKKAMTGEPVREKKQA